MRISRRLLSLALFALLLFVVYLASSAFVSYRIESFVNTQRVEWEKKGWKVSPLQWQWNIWKWTFYGVIPMMTIPLSGDTEVYLYWLEVSGCVLCRNWIRSVDIAQLTLGKKDEDWLRLERIHAISPRPEEWIARGRAIFGKNFSFLSGYPANFSLVLEREKKELKYDFVCITEEKYVYEGLGRFRLSPFLPISAWWFFQRAPYRGRLIVVPKDEEPEKGYGLRIQVGQWGDVRTALDALITADLEKKGNEWVIRGNLQGRNLLLGPVSFQTLSLNFWTEEPLNRWESDGKISFPLPRGFFFSLEGLPVHLTLLFRPGGVFLTLSGKIPEAQTRLIEKNIAETYRTFLPILFSLHPTLEWKSEILYEKGEWRFPLFTVDLTVPDGEGKVQFAFTPEKFTVGGGIKTEGLEFSAEDRGEVKFLQSVVHLPFLSHIQQMFPAGVEPEGPVRVLLLWNVQKNQITWRFLTEKIVYQGKVFESFQAEVKGNEWRFLAENPPLDALIFQDSAGCHYLFKTKQFPLFTAPFSATVTGVVDALLPGSPCITDARLFSLNSVNLMDISGRLTLHHTQFGEVHLPDTEWTVEKKGDRAQGSVFIQGQEVLWACEKFPGGQCHADADEWSFSSLSSYLPLFSDIFPAPLSFHSSFLLKPYFPGEMEFSTPLMRYQNTFFKEIKGKAVWNEEGIFIDATAFPEGAEAGAEPARIHIEISYANLGENLLPVSLKIAFPEMEYPLSPGISIVSSGEFHISLDLTMLPGKEKGENMPGLRSITGMLRKPQLRISLGERSLSFSSEEPVSLEVDSEKAVVLTPALLTGEAGKIEIQGGKFFPEPQGWTGTLDCTLHIPARVAELFFPSIFLEGEISAQATLALQGSQWSISAKGKGHSLSFSLPNFSLFSFRDADADWEIEGDILRLNRFSAVFSGGLVEGDGEVNLREKEARMNLRTNQFWLDFSPALEAKIAGNATLTLTPQGGFLWGSASVVKGTISLESLPVVAPAEFPYPIFFSFRLDVPAGVVAEGESFRFHPNGFLYFTGSYHSPRLYGTMQMQAGDEIVLLGKSFRVEEGELEWFGSLFNPRWHITASRREYPYLVTAVIEGSPETPEVSFFSDPPLASTDILAFLLTGRTLQEVGWEAGDLFAIALPAYLSTQIPSRLLERLSIVPFTARTGQKKPFLLIGKNLGEGIFLTYGMDLESGSESFTDVRWNFLPNWEAHFIRDTSQKLGGQLSYRSFLRLPSSPRSQKITISSFLWDSDLPVDLQEKVAKIPSLQKYTGEEEECRKILRFLQEQGYLRANCEAERKEDAVLFRIRSGALYGVELHGLPEQETFELGGKLLRMWANQALDRVFIQSASAFLRNHLYEKGFAFASLQAHLIYGPGTVQASFYLFPKNRIILNSVVYEGEFPGCPSAESCFPFHPGEPANRVLLLSSLAGKTREWKAEGYLDARLIYQEEQVGENAIKWTIQSFPGPLYRVRSFVGLPEEIPPSLIPVNQVFSTDWIKNSRQRIISFLQERGFLDATVEVSYRKEGEWVDVFFSVSKGNPYILRECRVEGTEDENLRRIVFQWIRCREGQEVSPEEIRKWRTRLMETGFFRSVWVELRGGEEQEQGVEAVVHVVPLVQAIWQASGGYLPDEGASASLSFSRNRILGQWRRISLGGGMAEKRQFAQALYSFTHARFPGVFFTAGASVEKTKITGLLEQRWGGTLSALYRKGIRSWYSFRLSADRYNYPGRPSESLLQLSASAVSDSRNDVLYPGRGHLTRWTVQFTPHSAKFTHLRSALFPLPPDSVLAFSLRSGIGFSLSFSEMFSPGGEISVRGLSPFALGEGISDADPSAKRGSFYLIGSAEFRRKFSKDFGGYTFLEGGNLWKKWEDWNWKSMRFSGGLGLFYLSPLGAFRIELARLLDPQPGEKKNRLTFSLGFPY